MTAPSHSESTGDGGEVTLTERGAVGVVMFSRPPQNHFSTPLIRSIANALQRADEMGDIRAVVLMSEGRNFCAGADLGGDKEEPKALYGQAERIFALRKPVVAAVQGAAIGGGLGLALAADFRVVAPSSRLAANFVKLGIHPGFGITLTLPRIVGTQRAAEILMLGERLNGEEAVACRLADRLVSEEDLQEAAVSLAARIADNAPLSVEATRATLRAGLLDAIRRQTAVEAAEQLRLVQSEDFAEGVKAVAERRPGKWKRR